MTIKFQADNDLNRVIVSAVVRREAKVDFQTARAAGLHGLSDAAVLVLTARDGRILVTHDLKTMPGHFATFIAEQISPGVRESSWFHNACLLGKSLMISW